MDSIVPISNGEISYKGDEAALRHIFPEELWITILNHLSPESKEFFLYSHPYFRRLLAPTSHLFLFPKVWKVLAANIEEKPSRSSYLRFEREPVTKPITKLVQGLRLVCKDWRNEIDEFYENLDTRLGFTDYSPHRERTGDWINFNVFQDYNNSAERFLQHFQNSHAATQRNPFLGRRVSFNFNTPLEQGGVPEEFLQLASEILRTYGHHIWYLTVWTDNEALSTVANYCRVRSMLLLTPNLKSLKWALDSRIIGPTRNANLTPEQVHQLASQMEAYPILRLEHLKKLCLNAPEVVAEHLVRVNNHVEVIECSQLTNWENLTFPNLTKLRIPWGQAGTIERLETFRVYNWKLEYLCLELENSLPFIPYERILSIVEIWKDTLVSVDLSPPAARTLAEVEEAFESFKGATFDLPKVKTFKLTLSNRPGVNFIFPDINMNKGNHCISWKLEEGVQMYMDDSREIVQVQNARFLWDAGRTARVFGFDGWKMFPALGTVKGVILPFQNSAINF